MREVIECARQVTGITVPTKVAPRREGDPPALFADAGRARRELGWSPRFVHIKEVVASAWVWHRIHPNGYGAS